MLAVAALSAPPSVVVSVFAAAALHECGHAMALCAFRVPIEGIRLTALGAMIYARGKERLSYGKELLATAAGPAVNLICALAAASAARWSNWDGGYLFSGAHVLLGLYNLLPVLPLDGGQLLYLSIAYFFGPFVGAAAAVWVGLIFSSALILFAAYLVFLRGEGMLFFLSALVLLIGALEKLGLAKGAIKV